MPGILQHMDHSGAFILLPPWAVEVVALPWSCARGITSMQDMGMAWKWPLRGCKSSLLDSPDGAGNEGLAMVLSALLIPGPSCQTAPRSGNSRWMFKEDHFLPFLCSYRKMFPFIHFIFHQG